MNKNKILYSIFAISFIILFSIFNLWEYINFHWKKVEIENQNKVIKESLDSFELSKVKELNDIWIYYTPYKKLLEDIVEKIENAEKEVLLETYILTEKRTQEALIKAHKKWVEVKVILEKVPYMAYNINNKSFEKLQKAWIDIVWSDTKNYALNHTKVLLIDNTSIISTWNYSYSTFTKNRDFFIFTTDENIRNKLKQNFENDYAWEKISVYNNNLVFSPTWSRIKFEKLFEWAEDNIKMYFQYLKDDELLDYLIQIKKEKDLKIDIILDKSAKDDDYIEKVKKSWINIVFLEKVKMHSKAILIDEKYLFIWSINFSNYSLDRNREVWIILKNKEIIDKFLDIFKQDIKNG